MQSEQSTKQQEENNQAPLEIEANPAPEFTEAQYEDAWANAPYWARQRFIKKTTKVKHRRAFFEASYKWVLSPATGHMLRVVDISKPYGLSKLRLPPSDLHKYIKAFIETYKTKEATNG